MFRFNEGEKYPSIQITAFKILQNVCFPPDYSPRTAVIHEKLQVKRFFIIEKLSMQCCYCSHKPYSGRGR